MKSFRPHRGLFFYLLSVYGDMSYMYKEFPSPPGTFLLSIRKCKHEKAEHVKFPSPPGTFLLSINQSASTHQRTHGVSVPTGDFSFIYFRTISFQHSMTCLFPSPPGTFLLSILVKHYYCKSIILFPSPPGTFLLSIICQRLLYLLRVLRFRPHRGLFFYLLVMTTLIIMVGMAFPSPPGTFLLSIFIFASCLKGCDVSVPTGDFSFIYIKASLLPINVSVCFRPHRGLFFYLWLRLDRVQTRGSRVSVPTGDFSFIYYKLRLRLASGNGFRPHRGLFFYLLRSYLNKEFLESFRPHRGLFFYLYVYKAF